MREAEYSSLRAELLEEQSSQASLLIALYTIFVAIITFALSQKNTYLCLIAIFINILFKLQILWKQTGIIRISAYLTVKFERDNDTDLSWESDIIECEKKYRNKKMKQWFKIISLSSSKIVSLMNLIAFICNLFILYNNDQTTLLIAIVEIIFGVAGVLFSLYLDRLQTPEKLREAFIQEFSQLCLNQKKVDA